MNPYLEQQRVWHDFHESFMPTVREVLTAQLDPAYVIKIDEHVFIHEVDRGDAVFLGRADLSVVRTWAEAPGAASALLEAPCEVGLPDVDTERVAYVEIRDRDSWKLVTVIELLSPSNKQPGRDREQFLAKRSQLLSSDVHYVELDLLRGGPRLPLADLPRCDYYALVSRVERRPRGGLWPIRLPDVLPTIPIPLRAPAADVRLDLQAILHRIYDAARYANWIYAGEPDPPLRADAAAWASELLRGSL